MSFGEAAEYLREHDGKKAEERSLKGARGKGEQGCWKGGKESGRIKKATISRTRNWKEKEIRREKRSEKIREIGREKEIRESKRKPSWAR